MLTIAVLQRRAWDTVETKGLHDNLRALPVREATMIRLALIHTEVSEALQEVKRKGVHEGNTRVIGEELADILIRVADLAEELKIDLEQATKDKLTVNDLRPYKYGTPEEMRR